MTRGWKRFWATARIVERNESTIRKFTTSRLFELKSAQVQTKTGFKTSRLLDEFQLFEVIQKIMQAPFFAID